MSNSGISIALATWNGASYLPELLDSLISQTVCPLEIVACDDGSTDETRNILLDYAERSSIPIRIAFNELRLGAPRNFARAMSLCRGEFIALADQDDIWHPRKLEQALDIFQKEKDIDLIVGDSCLVDSLGKFSGLSHWQQLGFNPKKTQRGVWKTLLKHNVLPGACMVLRSRLRDQALPLPDYWMHDYWLGLVACSTGKVLLISHPWQDYRQHDGNAIGAATPSLIKRVVQSLELPRRDYYAREIALWQQSLQRLQKISGKKNAADLEEKLRHFTRLLCLPSARLFRLPAILVELTSGRYYRYSRRWLGRALFDLLKR